MSDKENRAPILVPIDFSPESIEALAWAADIAACKKTELVVLHVVHDLGEAPGYYAVKGRKKQLHRMEDVASDMLDDFQKEMVEKYPKSSKIKSGKFKLVVGIPVSRILEIVDKVKAQEVVMGSKGRTGLGHLLLGSKAEQVVRLCPVPVTIVKTSNDAKEGG